MGFVRGGRAMKTTEKIQWVFFALFLLCIAGGVAILLGTSTNFDTRTSLVAIGLIVGCVFLAIALFVSILKAPDTTHQQRHVERQLGKVLASTAETFHGKR
ncbi:MAG: hypothetical protein LR017_01030 [Candidatus Pacebacteria bacterium]|nr:hypothetical protein [Candidatus Paceibacterota bacterium]